MKLTLKIWRQTGRKDKGRFVSYAMDDVNAEMSMLECLDVLNESLIERGEEPVAFEHDCREGICGSCGFMINGDPTRAASGDDGMPVDDAALQGRGGAGDRAVACRGLPCRQGPGGGSALV